MALAKQIIEDIKDFEKRNPNAFNSMISRQSEEEEKVFNWGIERFGDIDLEKLNEADRLFLFCEFRHLKMVEEARELAKEPLDKKTIENIRKSFI